MVVNNAKPNPGASHSSQTGTTAPKNDAKNPPHNTAAKQSPKETRTAVGNTFGDMPKNADAKQPVDAAKTPVTAPADGQAAQDGSGNPYMVLPNGKHAVTDTGNPVVYDKANANKPVAIDPKTGEAIKDARGNILAIGSDGNFIRTPEGNNVVYDKSRNKYNLVATDADGNFVTDQNGNALAVTKDGKFIPGVVYDKATGFRGKIVNGAVETDRRGQIIAVDEDGNTITGPDGRAAVYDPRGVPVLSENKTAPSGAGIYKDAATGELVGIKNGYVFKIDPATGNIAKDAQGNILPPIYDPVDSDATRPPVRPNENPDTMLKNLPHGTERGDPMTIKDELFDEYGNLDAGKVHEAAARYDARDIYDALINSSIHGGWNGLSPKLLNGGSVVHPNEAQARQAIAALIAWQNENGKYSPVRQGSVPPIIFYDGPDPTYAGYSTNGQAYVNVNLLTGSLAATVFHELNHSSTSGAFNSAYGSNNKHAEVITEFLATNWTGDGMDSSYEQDHADGMRSLEDAIEKMGNGDYNKGLDTLKRAYFAGDPLALEQLKKVFPPNEDFPMPDYRDYEGGDPSHQA